MEREHAITLFALRDFVVKSGFSKIHLGLSGGVDSSLVATLATQALGSSNVVGLLMPSPYSSEHSLTDALELAKNLNIETHMISLDDIYHSLKILLNKEFAISSLADENMQARLRGLYLMTYANSTGSLLLTTGNKSEIACGYGTLYGDMCGSYNPIGDLYKTEVYDLCRYINQQAGCHIIPEHVLVKAPSAELRVGQFDQESLPEYERLDRIIELLLQNRYTHDEIVCKSQTTIEEVLHVANLLRKSEFKRWQAPPVLKLRATHLGSSRCGTLLSTFKG
nr:NAD(+) synthase [Entomospira entomophilus]